MIQIDVGFVRCVQQLRGWLRRAASAGCVSACAVLLCHCSASSVHHDVISYGQFSHLRLFRPQAPDRHLALLLSGDGGWGPELDGIAEKLTLQGAVVAGVDVREWLVTLEQAAPSCVAPGASLAQLARYLQGEYAISAAPPVLIGHSAGATLAYVALAEARPHTFAGALTLSFCADLDLRKPLCAAPTLRQRPGRAGVRLLPAGALPAPWVTLHGLNDRECPAAAARDFVDAIPGARFIAIPDNGHTYEASGYWWGPFIHAYQALAAHVPPPAPTPQG